MRYVSKYVIFLIVLIIAGLSFFLWEGRSKFYEKALETTADIGFNIQEIDLFGRKNTTMESIENIIDMERGYPIFKVDIDAAQERLKKLAWVKNAYIRRQIPDKLVIEIEEYKPIAIWQNKGKHYIISEEGKVLTVSAENFTDLPIVVGSNAPMGTPLLLSYIETHFPQVKSRIKSLIREGGRRWSIVLDDYQNGIEIKLPEDSPNVALEELAIIEKNSNILEKNVKAIDLRMPDKIMVKFEKKSSSRYKGQDS